MSLEVDLAEFQTALRNYLVICKRTVAEILNRKLFYIAKRAFAYTPRAKREAVEQILGVSGYKLSKSKKTGTLKRGAAILSAGAPIFRIINAARGRAGEKGLYGAAMAQAARKKVTSRLRAIGSLQAGWLGPIKTLARAAKDFFSATGSLPRVKGQGEAEPAKEGFSPEASLSYNLASRTSAGLYIDPRVSDALQKAFQEETRDMEAYTIRRMQQDADTVNVP